MKPMYHTQTTDQNVAPYVLLPGDPHRVKHVAELWDEAEFIAENREHVTYTGKYKGMPITCTSTGMGCPSTAIVMEELARCGAKTFLRMGTCASLQNYINNEDIIIFDSACRFEGTSGRYVPPEFPAVADHEIVEASIQTAKRLGITYHVGTSRCTDAIYANRPDENTSFGGYRLHSWDSFLQDLKAMNVIAGEMESSIVMVLSRIFGLRGGALCICLGNLLENFEKGRSWEFSEFSYDESKIDKLCLMACESMYQIYLNDQEKAGSIK